MKRYWFVVAALAAGFALVGSAPGAGRQPLDMYVATVDRAQVGELLREGYDVAAVRQSGAKVAVDLVLSASERSRLEARGVKLGLKRTNDGKTVRQLAAEQ